MPSSAHPRANHRRAQGLGLSSRIVRKSRYLLVAGLAGSIGATISVMWRITFGRFSPSNAIIAFQQGKKASITLAILGAVRPFIGSVFGIIVYALDRADLLPDTLAGSSPPEGTLVR